jgi:hypothetical protein
MYKKIIVVFFLSLYHISVQSLDISNHHLFNINDNNCQFKYKIELNKYSGLFMCPYLGPKMIDELNKFNVCNLNKNEELQIISFELDSLFDKKYIGNLFFKTIGISEKSIKNISVE